MVSTQSSISSTTEDSDATKGDVPSGLSSTKSLTRAIELHRASSSASASRLTACSTQITRLEAYSSQSASQTWPEGGPRIRSQTLMLDFSRCERCSSYFRNSTSSSSTTSTQKALVGEHPSKNCTVEDTAARNVASCSAISIW
jgi:hypothetical protein